MHISVAVAEFRDVEKLIARSSTQRICDWVGLAAVRLPGWAWPSGCASFPALQLNMSPKHLNLERQ
jgi:hypothetical protein